MSNFGVFSSELYASCLWSVERPRCGPRLGSMPCCRPQLRTSSICCTKHYRNPEFFRRMRERQQRHEYERVKPAKICQIILVIPADCLSRSPAMPPKRLVPVPGNVTLPEQKLPSLCVSGLAYLLMRSFGVFWEILRMFHDG